MTDQTQKQTRPVLAAIARITGSVGAVEKKGRNSFHNYEFATAADIMHRLQPLMAAEELVIVPTVESYELISDGQAMLMMFSFNVAHASGDELGASPRFAGVATCKNSKGGFDDKVANKCMTGAMKYFLLNLFKIPTGDYHDADGEEDTAPRAERASPARDNGRPATKAPDRKSAAHEAAAAIQAPSSDFDPADEPATVPYMASNGKRLDISIKDAVNKLWTACEADAVSDKAFDDLLKRNEVWMERHAKAALAAMRQTKSQVAA